MTEMPPPVPDAGSTEGAAVAADESKGCTFPCEGCGADLHFSIDAQKLRCPFCGFEKDLEVTDGEQIEERDFRSVLQRLQDQRRDAAPPVEDCHEVQCDSCGGTVQFTGTLTSTECAFCGSPIQREGVHDAGERLPVDGVLPFLVEESRAAENLRAWVKSRWFLPNQLKKRGVQGGFQGVYQPYWTFDAMTANQYSGQRGEYYYVTVGSGKNRKRVRRTRWYPASGDFRRFFDDVLAVAGKGLPDKLVRALEPWPLEKCLPFQQELLAGHLARTYDIPLDQGFEVAKLRIEEAITHEVRQRIGGDTQRIDRIHTDWPALTYKHLLLPLWLLSYRFKDKAYQVTVNAATGEVQGERPWSWIKITALVLGLGAIAATVFFLTR